MEFKSEYFLISQDINNNNIVIVKKNKQADSRSTSVNYLKHFFNAIVCNKGRTLKMHLL